MHTAYIIEIDEQAVGIAAPVKGGFRFHAALHAFNRLDGAYFGSVREATRAARAVAAASVTPGGPPPRDVGRAESLPI